MSPDKGLHRAIRVARKAGRRLVVISKMWEPQERACHEHTVLPLMGGDVEFLDELSAAARIAILRSATAVLSPISRHRTVLLEDPTLLRLLRRYQRETGYTHGPPFRAERDLATSPLRYQSVHACYAIYATTGGLTGSLHDLRHAHAQRNLTAA